MYQIISNVFFKGQNGTKAVETQIQKTPCKAFEDLKSTPRRLRKRKYEEAFRNATSELHGDIKSVKVTLELRNGNTLSFYPRQGSEKDNSVFEDDSIKHQKDLKLIQRVISIKDK